MLQHFRPHIWLVLLCLLADSAAAQFRFGAPSPFGEPRSTLPSDPQTEAALRIAQEALEAGRTGEGLEALQTLLEQGEDFFLAPEPSAIPGETGEDETPRPRLSEVIAAAQRQHLTEYEELYGAQARVLLDAAIESQDVQGCLDVARRYGLTTAGAQAMEFVAGWRLRQGEFGGAARWWERLQEHPAVAARRSEFVLSAIHSWTHAGVPQAAQALFDQHLTELQAAAPARQWPVPVAGDYVAWLRQLKLSSPARSLDSPRLLAWTVPAGDASQSGWADPAWLSPEWAWSHALLDEFDELPAEGLKIALERLKSTATGLQNQASGTLFPAARPLVVGDRLITTAYGGVRCFDRTTGELLWPGVVIDDTCDYLFRSSFAPGHPQNHDAVLRETQDFFFACRGWRDLTSASLSTDGKNVYVVRGCRLPAAQPMFLEVRDPRLPQRDNQLHAFDLRTGALRWSLMGEAPLNETPVAGGEPTRSAIFFYGAPVAVEQRLFCLGEERGQVQLFELNPDAILEGEILWSLPLHDPPPGKDILQDHTRRLSGLMPAYAGGLLICPTGGGSVLAVDIEQRQVVWHRQYAEPQDEMMNAQFLRGRFNVQVNRPNNFDLLARELLSSDRWFDARLLIAGDKILYSPPDHDELVCLSLLTGEPVWQQPVPRDSAVYVAGIYEDCAILVGTNEVQLLKLDDGAPLWPAGVKLPPVAGRGIRLGEMFLQPVSTGEVAYVDLQQGRLVGRVPLPGNAVSGNLVAAQGQLFFQSGDQIAALQQLSRQAESSLAQAEWELQQGHTTEAISRLRQIVQQDPSQARAKQILCWTMLEEFSRDFAKYKDLREEIESYCVTSEQRRQFLLTLGNGLRESNDVNSALEVFFGLLALDNSTGELEQVQAGWHLSPERRLAGELLAMLQQTTDQGNLASAFEKLPQAGSGRLALLRVFPPETLPVPLLLEALQPAATGPSLLQRESAGLRLLNSSSPHQQLAGWYVLAQTALEQQDGLATTRCLEQLVSFPAEVTILEGRTGAQLAEQIKALPQTPEVLAAGAKWPAFAHADESSSGAPATQHLIAHWGGVNPVLEGWTFFLNQDSSTILIYDGDGVLRGSVPTGTGGNLRVPGFARYVQTRGHLASVVCQDRILLIDLSSALGKIQEIRSLATFTYLSEGDIRTNPLGNSHDEDGLRGPRSRCQFPDGTWSCNAGPLLDTAFCLTRGDELLAVEPTSGQVVWRRLGIPAGSEVIGDEEYTCVVSRETRRLLVFRTLNGEQIRDTTLPGDMLIDWSGIDWGRMLPTSAETKTGAELQIVDPATGNVAWKMSVDSGVDHLVSWGGKAAAILNISTGELRGLSLETGEVQWRSTLANVKTSRGLTTHDYGQYRLLVTYHLPTAGVGNPGGITVGLHFLEAATGQVKWEQLVSGSQHFQFLQTPSRWPLLVVLERDLQQRRKQSRLLVFQQETGELVAEDSGLVTLRPFAWKVDKLPYHRIRLAFGDQDLSLKCLESPPANPSASGVKAAPQQEE